MEARRFAYVMSAIAAALIAGCAAVKHQDEMLQVAFPPPVMR